MTNQLFDLHIRLDGRRQITAQLYQRIRDAILDGRLEPDAQLPSSRELARRLHLSRHTVVVAYERLRSEGFLRSSTGSGTFVGSTLRPPSEPAPSPSPLTPRTLWSQVEEPAIPSPSKVLHDFRPGIPDTTAFPHDAWRARLARASRQSSVGHDAHLHVEGLARLRGAIARHLSVSRGVRATPDDVFVTSGSQQAVDLLARVLLEPGDLVAVEDPGYLLSRRAFLAHGCPVAGVPVDEEGIIVDEIPEGVRLVHVTPSHQYPLGVAMSPARRQALLEWAERTDAAILEDDYDSEFRYSGRPLEPLHSLDRNGRVLFVGSFSRVMLPTLRLGFAVLPKPLHTAFRKAKSVTDWHTAVPLQAATADLLDEGILAQHIRRLRRTCAERHRLLLELLGSDFAGILTPIPSVGGLHLAAFLEGREPPEDGRLVDEARRAGVAVEPLSRHYLGRPPRAGLILGFGAIEAADLEMGLERLRAALVD